jgi:hypothetical protein
MEQKLKFFREKDPKTHEYARHVVVLLDNKYIANFDSEKWICSVIMTKSSGFLGLRFFKKTRDAKLRLGTPIVWIN